MSPIVLVVAARAFAAGAARATVTVGIVGTASLTGKADLSFGAIRMSGAGSGTIGVTTKNEASVTGAGATLLPSPTTRAANFAVSGKGARAFTLAIDSRVTLTNTASSGGTLTVTTANDAGCPTSCSLPGMPGDAATANKVVNVAGSFPFDSTTNAGAYVGNLSISVIYN
jgi:hypothetical protein